MGGYPVHLVIRKALISAHATAHSKGEWLWRFWLANQNSIKTKTKIKTKTNTNTKTRTKIKTKTDNYKDQDR
jgi:hypothetical protein